MDSFPAGKEARLELLQCHVPIAAFKPSPILMKFSLALGTALMLSAGGTQAQEAAAPLWEVGLIGGFASTPTYPAANERTQRVLALPFLIYRGEVLRADRDGLSARVLHTSDVDFDVGFSASLPSRANDSIARQGMADLGTLLELGPRLKWTLSRPSPDSRLQLQFPLRAVLELRDGVSAQGLILEPELNFQKRHVGAGWSLAASIGAVFGDRKRNNFFYGVAPQYATVSRPTFDAQAGLISSRLSLSTSKHLNSDWRLFGFLRFENYAGTANQASPLHLQTNATSVGLALAWTLGRSERRAQE